MGSKSDRAHTRTTGVVYLQPPPPEIIRELRDSKSDSPNRPAGIPREIPVSEIHVPGHNIRTEFDTPKDEELVQSIRENGVLERLLVRDNSKWRSKDDQKPDYDLMAGERRLRAAIKAGLTSVPCEVFDVDDEKAYEIMLIENLQSKDLHELDYAKGLQIMMKRFGYNVEQTAARIQKGETFVREMLSFPELPDFAEKAFREGVISKSHAVLISTIPGTKEREDFAKRVVEGRMNSWQGKSLDPLSVREAKELKERDFMKDLKGAPFPLDQRLDSAWPYSCLECPHYNGNTPEARQGKRPNICLNPPHFEVMAREYAKAEANALKESGATVLSKSETAKVFSGQSDHYYLTYPYGQGQYVKMNDEFTDYAGGGHKRVSWKEVSSKAELDPVIAFTADGRPHKLLLKKTAEEAAKKLGHKLTYLSPTRSTARKKTKTPSEKAREQTCKAQQSAVSTLINKILALNFSRATKVQWQQLAEVVLAEVLDNNDFDEFLLPLLGMPKCKRHEHYTKGRKFSRQYLSKLKSVGEVQAFVATILVVAKVQEHVDANYHGNPGPFSKDALAMAKAFGVDLLALEKRALTTLQATPAKTPAARAVKKGKAKAAKQKQLAKAA